MNPQEIQQFLSEATEKEYQSGEVIFEEGQRDSNFYFIVEGSVEISKKDSAGKPKVIAELESGEFLGEGILSGSNLKPATAKTNAPAHLLILSHDEFLKLSEEKPKKMVEFLLMVLESTNERLTQTNTKLLSLFEINQILSLYQEDPKTLSQHVLTKLISLTDSQNGLFFIKNPFSESYRLLYSTFDTNENNYPKNWLSQTQKLQINQSEAVNLSLGDSGAIILIKEKNQPFSDDQIKILSLIAEQMASVLKNAMENAAEKAKKILERKHFEI